MLLLAQCLITIAALLSAASPLHAQLGPPQRVQLPQTKVGSVQNDTWYFTAEEMEAAYKYQEYFGPRFANPLKPEQCLFGSKNFAASYRGKQFLAPCRFVTETVRHLKEIVQTGAGRYFFPLDIGHADLAIPLDVWERKYGNRSSEEILSSLLRETSLVSVYQPGAHLKALGAGKLMANDNTGKRKPDVLAHYDGSAVVVVGSTLNSFAAGQYQRAGTIYFLAHRFGEILFTVGRKPIMLDMSFDHDVAE